MTREWEPKKVDNKSKVSTTSWHLPSPPPIPISTKSITYSLSQKNTRLCTPPCRNLSKVHKSPEVRQRPPANIIYFSSHTNGNSSTPSNFLSIALMLYPLYTFPRLIQLDLHHHPSLVQLRQAFYDTCCSSQEVE